MKALLKFKKTGFAFLVIVLLALSMSVPVLASSTIDMKKLGSITINMTGAQDSTDDSFSGIKFTVYQVAELSSSGDYSLTKDFQSAGLQLDQLSTASSFLTASKTLAGYVSEKNISGVSNVTNQSGTVKFGDLALGYYLVVQADALVNQSIHNVCDPFLVAVSMKYSGDSDWVYDIVANSKSEPAAGAVILQKTNSSGTLLSGAVFRLDKKVYYTDSESLPSGTKTYSDSNGNYYWKLLTAELTTNQYGQIAVKSMPYGQYRFIEITAPDGYALDSTPHLFLISAVGTVTVVNGKYVTATGTVQTITVINSTTTQSTTPTEDIPEDQVPKSGFDFPKTGGSISYAVCTYGGMFLMVCSLAVFLISRRKKEK